MLDLKCHTPYLHRLRGFSLGSEGFLERGGIRAILIRPSDLFWRR